MRCVKTPKSVILSMTSNFHHVFVQLFTEYQVYARYWDQQ